MLDLGWTEADIARRAEDAQPISGVGRGGPRLAYRHRLVCYVPLDSRFAVLTLAAYVTPPNTPALPMLGRQEFLAPAVRPAA